jgi:hypothetical protein
MAVDACLERIYTVFSGTYEIPWSFFLNLVSQVQFLQGVPFLLIFQELFVAFQ